MRRPLSLIGSAILLGLAVLALHAPPAAGAALPSMGTANDPSRAALAAGLPREVCGPLLRSAADLGAAVSPSDSVVEARLVFVAFPDWPVQALPAWTDAMRDTLEDFLRTMSRGKHRLRLRVLKRDDDSTQAWIADSSSLRYAAVANGYGMLNREIMQRIRNRVPGAWDGVQQVFMIHYQCAFPCGSATAQGCEDNCPYGGIATLGCSGDLCAPGFKGTGVTQRFYYPFANEVFNEHLQMAIAAHEYGHILGASHSPGTDSPPPEFVNMGRYDVMRSGRWASEVWKEGLVPYHPVNLANWGWLPKLTVLRDTTLVIPDVFGPDAFLVEIPFPGSSERLVLANHEASTPYDVRYGGAGLLIWHVLHDPIGRADLAWDLESAAGRFTGVAADPESGADELESSVYARGSPLDFYGGVVADYACGTNPSSARYSALSYAAPRSIPSSVAVENITRDPLDGTVRAEIFVTPKQRVVAPAPGAWQDLGEPVVFQWQVRPFACIDRVDLEVVDVASGEVATLASGLPNSGAYSWLPARRGRYRVRVVSHDAAGGVGVDEGEIAIGLGASADTLRSLRIDVRPNPARGPATLALELPQPARVDLEILDLAGRRVRALSGWCAGSGGCLQWDRRDAEGRRVPAGIYLARVTAGPRRAERKIVVLP